MTFATLDFLKASFHAISAMYFASGVEEPGYLNYQDTNVWKTITIPMQ